MNDLSKRIANLSPEKRALLEKRLREEQSAAPPLAADSIAVIGMGCRFPGGANSPEAFWELLKRGFDAVTETPPQRWDADAFFDSDPRMAGKANTRWGGYLDQVDQFDAAFFGIPPHEAARMDPQQRLLLEVASEAFEDAGQSQERLTGSKSGVFVGILSHSSDYYWMQVGDLGSVDGYTSTGTAHSIMANRLSYQFNLQGPSMAVDTACSSSLVAVHLAIQSLRSHECDLALAGGVHLLLAPENTVVLTKLNMMAPDGHCKTFDSSANGFVRGEGCGLIVLKRLTDALADGDHVLAIIRGSAVNQDGRSNGITAPNGLSQENLLRDALKNSGVAGSRITYVETHGTGTALGDPIEVEALNDVIGKNHPAEPPCVLGSVKTNIGHLEAAAGIAGLIKTVLCLQHRWIPPILHFKELNPHISLQNTPFVIAVTGRPWDTGSAKRVAGVSSFGFGGTNAHIILEEGSPAAVASVPEMQSQNGEAAQPFKPAQLLTISARSADALRTLARSYRDLLARPSLESPSFTDICYSSAIRRTHHNYRFAAVGSSLDQLRASVDAFLQDKPQGYAYGHPLNASSQEPVFVFSGQGPQWFGMGRELLRDEPIFREAIEKCDAALRRLAEWSLLEEMAADESRTRLTETQFAQPAIFALQVGLVRLFREWGVLPAAVIGHSVGEVAAAYISGALNFEDAIYVIYQRGRLMQRATGHGRMASIELPLAEIEEALAPHEGRLSVAAINSPTTTVVSGDPKSLEQLLQALENKGVTSRPLPVNYAFHSYQMDPLQADLKDSLRSIRPGPTSIPLFSTVTGGACDGASMDAEYWWRNIRQPVRFASGIEALLAQNHSLFLEIGAHPVLAPAVSLCLSHHNKEAIVTGALRRGQNERSMLLTALGHLYTGGCAISWSKLYAKQGWFVDLPKYAWQRKRFWLEPFPKEKKPTAVLQAASLEAVPHCASDVPAVSPTTKENFMPPVPKVPRKVKILDTLIPILQELSGLELSAIRPELTFVEMGFDSLFLTQVSQAFSKKFGTKISIRQMWEDLNSLDRIASYLDQKLPPDPVVEEALAVQPGVVASAAAQPHISVPQAMPPVTVPVAPATPHSAPLASAGQSIVERVVQEQLQIMTKQLEVLRALGSPPESPTIALATAPPAKPAAVPTPALTPSIPGDPSVASNAAAHGAGDGQPQPAAHGPFRPISKGSAQSLTQAQQDLIDSLIRRYTARTRQSKELTQTHRARLADPRSLAGFSRVWKEMVYPIVVERSSGAHMWDVDGNEYVDFTMGFGTNLLGHSPAFVKKALQDQVENGIEVGPQSPLAGQVAELMCELTGMERCAFCNTGSEAVLAAIRMARTVTGRDLIVYFGGDYHGIFDEVLQRPGSSSSNMLLPVAPGIPGQPTRNVLILEYGNPQSLNVIRARGSEIAAVLVEPVQSRHPGLQPSEFVQKLREITKATGSALIFDEVITGFRSHLGGIQALWGIRADLATYGKVIGGGMPIGAICGSATFMDSLDGGPWQYGDDSMPEVGVTYFAGTYVRHPLTLAAAKATLEHLKAEGPKLQQRLNERTAALVQELADFLAALRVPIHLEHFSSFFWVVPDPKLKYANLLYFMLRDKGIHIFEGRIFLLSTAHTESDLQHLVQAFKESITEMVEVGLIPGESDPPDPQRKASSSIAVAEPTAAPVLASPAPPTSLSVVQQSMPALKSPSKNSMKFGMYFFGNYPAPFTPVKYQTILTAAKMADQLGFSAIWIPERHFHAVGGFSPNPAVIAAAIARETRQIQLRAGSVVLPLHNPIRVAEEWSVVDNLSDGRVGLSIASGWHPNDFVFAPDAYEKRRELCMEGVDVIRKLWSGQSIPARGGNGNALNVSLYPMPKQRDLPLWLTCVSTPSYEKAGELGMGVLAMLTNQSLDEIAEKIALYRRAREKHGLDPATGNVTVLIHTFVARDREQAIAKARGPMREYLRSYLDNSQRRHDALSGSQHLEHQDLEYLLDRSFEDYVNGKTLIGSPESCAPFVRTFAEIGIDEIGCFVDFGIDPDSLIAAIPYLGELKKQMTLPASPAASANVSATDGQIQMSSANHGRTLPLPEAQEGLWLLTKMAPDANRAYMESSTLDLSGPLQLGVLKMALQAFVDRHEALRSTMDLNGEHQTIHDHLPLDVPFVDLSSLPEQEKKSRLKQQFHDLEAQPFDFVKGPFIRFRVFCMEPEHHILVIVNHHIFGNGPSYEVLMNEICDIYGALAEGTQPQLQPAMQLSDYVHWREQQSQSAEFHSDHRFWVNLFSDSVPVIDLPLDRPRPPVLNYRGGRQSLMIEPELTASLRAASKGLGASLFVTMFSAFNLLLHRLSGQSNVIVGVPFEGEVRSLPGGSRLFANTTNMLPLRSRFEPDTKFPEFLSASKAMVFDANEHQSYFFGRLTRDLKLRPDASRPPIIAASFNIDAWRGYRKSSGGVQFELLMDGVPFGNPTDASKFELNVNIVDKGAELRIDCDYSAELFEAATVGRWLRYYVNLLQSIVSNPHRTLSALPLLTETERDEIVFDWNKTDLQIRLPTVMDAFEAQVERAPDSRAVTFEGLHLSYEQLNARATVLAQHLKTLGVGPNVLVGILLERSLDMMVALLAVLKAGGGYVPLDPAFPQDRLDYMIGDSKMAVLITHRGLESKIKAPPASIIRLDAEWSAIARRKGAASLPRLNANDLAYVLYTSGSTGRPKGVEIPHSALMNFLASMQLEPGFSQHDTLLAVTTLCFDIAGLELYLPLISGGKLVIASRDDARDPLRLLERMRDSRCTVMQATPATWRALIDAGWRGAKQLRILCGGEAFPSELAHDLLTRCSELWNVYGPTETTIWSSVHRVTRADSAVPIGHPIANTQFYILDADRNLVPPGVIGELYIGGAGLARGYLNRPDLTQERFVPNPFVAGANMYRTSDLGRWRADGTLECLGRADSQVKIRGFRIELGEIESTLDQHPAIRQAVVVVHEDHLGLKQLIAYLEPQNGAVPSSSDLRAYLKQKLPDYMVPSAFIAVTEFPMTPNRKIDRKALPRPTERLVESKEKTSTPRDDLERTLVDLWSAILERKVGIHDDFFDLGGHSLVAVKLLAEIKRKTGKTLPLTAFFHASTVDAFAELLRKDNLTSSTHSLLVPIRPAGSKPPLFLVHGAEGNVLLYRQFVQYLDSSQPVYGIESAGIDGGEDVEQRTVEGIATRYLEEILKVQPHGPFFLGGYCLGGIIALEMAQQLKSRGEEVGLVVMLDTYNYSTLSQTQALLQSPVRFLQNLWFHLANVATIPAKDRRQFLLQKWDVELSRLGVRAQAALQGLWPFGKSKLNEQYPHLRIKKANDKAALRYTPSAYIGRVAVLRPKAAFIGESSPTLAWDRVISEGLEIHQLPVYPKGMLVEPFCRNLAEMVQLCLATATKPDEAQLSAVTAAVAPSRGARNAADSGAPPR